MRNLFIAKLNYQYSENLTNIQTISEPFLDETIAKQFIKDQKICMSLMDAILIEAKIENIKEIILDYDAARAFMKSLKLRSKEEYFNWWDKHKPSFIPRDPESFYRKHAS